MAKHKKKNIKKSSGKSAPKFASDMELLDYLKDTIVGQIEEGTINLKVGDLLKIVEIQRKLSSDTSAEKKFWEIIEQIRKTELDED